MRRVSGATEIAKRLRSAGRACIACWRRPNRRRCQRRRPRQSVARPIRICNVLTQRHAGMVGPCSPNQRAPAPIPSAPQPPGSGPLNFTHTTKLRRCAMRAGPGRGRSRCRNDRRAPRRRRPPGCGTRSSAIYRGQPAHRCCPCGRLQTMQREVRDEAAILIIMSSSIRLTSLLAKVPKGACEAGPWQRKTPRRRQRDRTACRGRGWEEQANHSHAARRLM
jgi:hypothetical protein